MVERNHRPPGHHFRNTLNARSPTTQHTYSHRSPTVSKHNSWLSLPTAPLNTHTFFQDDGVSAAPERPAKRARVSKSSPIRGGASGVVDLSWEEETPMPFNARRAGASADPVTRPWLQSQSAGRVLEEWVEEEPTLISTRKYNTAVTRVDSQSVVRLEDDDTERATQHVRKSNMRQTSPDSHSFPSRRSSGPGVHAIKHTSIFDQDRPKQELHDLLNRGKDTKRPEADVNLLPAKDTGYPKVVVSRGHSSPVHKSPNNGKSLDVQLIEVQPSRPVTSRFFQSKRCPTRVRDRMQDSGTARRFEQSSPTSSMDELNGPTTISFETFQQRKNNVLPKRKKRTVFEVDHISDSEPEPTRQSRVQSARAKSPLSRLQQTKPLHMIFPDEQADDEDIEQKTSPQRTMPWNLGREPKFNGKKSSPASESRLAARDTRPETGADCLEPAEDAVTEDATTSRSERALPRRPARPEPKDKSEEVPKGWSHPLTWPFDGPKQVSVDYQDLSRLGNEEFLNDNLVNFCLRHLEVGNAEAAKSVYFFNTYFYDALTKLPTGRAGFNYDAVKRWTKRVDLFSYDHIIIPVNRNFHWYLFIVSNLRALVAEDEVEAIEDPSKEVIVNHVRAATSTEDQPLSSQETRLSELDMDKMSLTPRRSERSGVLATLASSLSHDIFKAGDSGDDSRTSRRTQRLSRGQSRGVFKPDEPIVIALDSMGGEHITETRNIKKYLINEARERRDKAIAPKDINSTTAKGIPTQTNASDCGIFLIGYVTEFLHDPRAFVEKVCSREMDEANSFRNFDADRQRHNIRRTLVALEKQAKARRIQAKKAKALGKAEEDEAAGQVKAELQATAEEADVKAVESEPGETGAEQSSESKSGVAVIDLPEEEEEEEEAVEETTIIDLPEEEAVEQTEPVETKSVVEVEASQPEDVEADASEPAGDADEVCVVDDPAGVEDAFLGGIKEFASR